MTLRERLKAAADRAEQRRSEFPPLATQAQNFAKAIGRSAGAIVTCKEVLVREPEREERLRICRACERFEPRRTRCKECGCMLKAKLRMATETCPIGKW